MAPRRASAAVALALVLAAGCSAPESPGGGSARETAAEQEDPGPAFARSVPAQATTVVPTADAASTAVATSRALYDRAPSVVLAGADDEAAHRQAEELGAPLLVTTGDAESLREELARLETETALAVGLDPEGAATAVDGTDVEVVTDAGDLPEVGAGAPLTDVLVLSDGTPETAAATATARAAGARVHALPGGDPRTDPELITALAESPPSHVLALGSAFGDADTLASRVDVASTGVQLPGGGQVAFPHRRMIALYGHPGTASLGVLGEQPLEQALQRARDVAAQYEEGSDVPVVPAFEIIATVASSAPGADGDYSAEADVEDLRPWVEAAGEAGVYVVLDLQPGRTDFLTQAQRYADLLAMPHVGLALDPEWRLAPGQRHLEQIGSVSAAEVNAVITWLADLTRDARLPQKVLVLHQFRLSMISDRQSVDTSRDEVAVVIHADGNGTPEEKLATWDALRATPPAGVHWAWKNFYDEDRPTFTPQETLALEPPPVLVSYQ